MALRVVTVQETPSVAAAILAPERELGLDRYALVLTSSVAEDPLPSEPSFFDGRAQSPIAWQTSPSTIRDPPAWSRPPSVLRSVSTQSCPSASYVEIAVPVSGGERVLAIQVDVAELAAPAAAQRYLVVPREGAIAIGHLGCHVNVELVRGKTYRVTLRAIGCSGSEFAAPGGPLTVKAPQ